MAKTKKQLMAERAAIEAALIQIEKTEQKIEDARRRSQRDEWCTTMLEAIGDAPLHIRGNGVDQDQCCLFSHLIASRAFLERLLTEECDA